MRCSIVNRPTAFTLLEVTLAVAIAGIVLTGVYQVARTSFELNAETGQLQQQETTRQAFVDLLRREFRHLPAESRVSLSLESTGDFPQSTLRIENAPMAFSFGGAAGHDAVALISEPAPDGTTIVLLRYHWKDREESRDLVLLRGVTAYEIRCLNTTLNQWQTVWPAGGSRPSQIELNLGFAGEPPQSHALWIPRIVPSALKLQPLVPQP